eukprot:TRINITY_DN59857_c0_g1_i1.p1 TRINITY_DN59857_c0_g1~~TRINITY_DN59857_c0_g1_i1.p1  ORF type:complete len:1040 (-),score=119.02 TRINITY_DN59857_c0_g1_i1:150-3209(-)
MEHWQKLYSFTNNGVPVSKWESKRTGMRICLAEVPFPEVNGFFTLATESWCHDGCPHTLEHLIFLGSEDFPYKGMLDQLANRCFAQGTNAWTDNDHTCYTVTTSGSEGFLRILPTYIDHLLYPTLTDEAFNTEVHHFTGEGESEGVVYSEMQARENTCDERADAAIRAALWKDTPYVYNSGGLMADLRTLTNDTIKKFHAAHYRPNNLCLIITGKVTIEQLVAAVEPMEQKILNKGGKEVYANYDRPWGMEIPQFEKSVKENLTFPDDNADDGAAVNIATRGPQWNNQKERCAIKCLLQYLTDSAVSPVRKQMIDCENPVAGDCCAYQSTYKITDVQVQFSGIKTAKIEEVEPAFRKVIQEQISSGLDMKRLHEVITTLNIKRLKTLESSPESIYCYGMIDDFLYAKRDGSEDDHFKFQIDQTGLFEEAKSQPPEYWTQLLKRLFVDQPSVVVLSRPDDKESNRLQEEVKARVKKFCEEVGKEKLEKFAEETTKATEYNDRPYPDGFDKNFPVPKVEGITFIPIRTYRSDGTLDDKSDAAAVKTILDNDTALATPVWIQFDDINSMFVELRALMDVQDVPPELLDYIELYLDVAFELPIETEEYKYTYEETVSRLAAETASKWNTVGLRSCGDFACSEWPTILMFCLKLQRSDYGKGVRWLRDLLWNTKFDDTRLKISCTRLIDSIPEVKRSGSSMMQCMANKINYQQTALKNVCGVLHQADFLAKVKAQLEESPADVLSKMEQLRTLLTRPNTLRVHVATSFADVVNPKSAWIDDFIPKKLVDEAEPVAKPLKSPSDLRMKENKGKAVLGGVPATESSYLVQTVPGILGENNPKAAAGLVLCEYLTACEGPFWKQLRGQGLTYSYSLYFDLSVGVLVFVLARSTNVAACYKEAKNIMEEFINGKEFNESEFAGAKSAAISGIVGDQGSISAAISSSLREYVVGAPHGWVANLISQVNAVTIQDLQALVKEFLPALLDPTQCNSSAVCNPSKVEEFVATFKDAGKPGVEAVDVEKFCKY